VLLAFLLIGTYSVETPYGISPRQFLADYCVWDHVVIKCWNKM